MDYLHIESLQVDYKQNNNLVPAVKDLSFSLARGHMGVIIGPSGCGKSTLLHVLAGLNKNYRGTVRINGRSPSETAVTALILQEYGLLPWKTVGDNVRLGMQIRKVPKKLRGFKTEEILEKMGLLHLSKRFPSQLSGGQRQRVAIARSLLLEPELLLMDEPFSSLDALTREEMQDLLLKLWQETGLTVLLVTHNIEEAVFLGQKIFIMSQCPGTIIRQMDNPLAGDYAARGKVEFVELADSLRSELRRRTEVCS